MLSQSPLFVLASSLFLLPSSLLAAESGTIVAPGGGVIAYTNAAEVTTIPADGSILLKFLPTDAENPASFVLPGISSARILAVGGGGGGGGAFRGGFSGNYGGGGGGGAGGFIEVTNLYNAATYTVNVGEGGEGGVKGATPTATCTGKDGGDTFIATNGVDMIRAYGGGGGGSQGAGNPGGSGGGGSMKSSGAAVGLGGEPKDASQGHAGGKGDKGMYGGGGGGAGAAGADASSENPVGGNGLPSDITGAEKWYAGGGGGSHSDKSITKPTARIAGGQGGGGQGGVGKGSGTAAMGPTAGEDGTGGGGGGCDANTTGSGADGGSGIVYVRILASGTPVKPHDDQVEFDGETHYPIAPSPFLITTGNDPVSEVGIYTATAKPIEGLTWDDGSTDEVKVTFVIYEQGAKCDTIKVTGAPVSFAGAVTNYWVDNGESGTNLVIGFSKVGTFTLPGSSSVRILAVGGGGGGGGAFRGGFSGNYGGGGGGGAGGFIEVTNLYGAATYTVSVGSGGEGGVKGATPTATCTGKDGEDTFIVTNGIDMIRAYGGGGGGSQGAGNPGGSGGGGSMKSSGAAVGLGGEPKDASQGHAGGKGDKGMYGGGGGGAGAAGADASSENPVGGNGLPSDITGAEKWYAGGGGGSHSDKSITKPTARIAGGQGGGGQGGVGKGSGTAAMGPTAGEDGTGGGGGGCDANTTGSGGKGGSGIVWIQISSAMKGEFKRPEPTKEVVYDREEHNAIEPSVFYDISGDNVGTTAGVYVATATLKPGVGKWPGSDDGDPATVTMTILPRVTTFSNPHVDNWEYLAEKTPEPTCEVDPEWVEAVYEWRPVLTSGEDAASPLSSWKPWSEGKPEDVGEYQLRVGAPTNGNFSFDYAYTNFFITKIRIEIRDLRQRDWMAGDPTPPAPTCTVVVAEIARAAAWKNLRYYYAPRVGDDAATVTDWSEEKPTAAGHYWIKAEITDKDNFDSEPAYAEFDVLTGLGGIFTDYVEITVGSHSPDLTNFPWLVTLSEDDPVGFLYSRAGADGNAMTFTDSTGTNVLWYAVRTWDTNDVSEVHVLIPAVTNAEQKIRLYWHVRDGADTPEHHPELVWETWGSPTNDAWKAAWEGAEKPAKPYSAVSRDGYLVNYWAKEPKLSKQFWTVQEGKTGQGGRIDQDAVAAFENDRVVRIFTNILNQTGYRTLPVTNAGSFRVVYTLDDPTEKYLPLEAHIDYAVWGATSYDDLKGSARTLTLSGRIMLANDDLFGKTDPNAKYAVTDQSYWQTREVTLADGTVKTNDVFWTHEGETTPYDNIANLRTNHIHQLHYIGADGRTNTLWRFENIRFGNEGKGSTMVDSHYYLPYSSTSLPISSADTYQQALTDSSKRGQFAEVGNIVMRNTYDEVDEGQWAVVYSPCYTNGIGTIYFDAVNGQRNNLDSYRLVVEVATGNDVVDEYAEGPDKNGGHIGLGMINKDRWKPYPILTLLHKGASSRLVIDESQSNPKELAVEINDITAYKKTDNFYRACVKVNEHGPCRFRIRRTASVRNVSGAGIDQSRFIILDNILVSYPNMSADLSPFGKYDGSRAGKQILGTAGAMSVPFPAAGQGGVFARAKKKAHVNDFVPGVTEDSLVIRAQMMYRWRYLDQAFDPEVPGDEAERIPLLRSEKDPSVWRSAELWPADGLVSREALKIPNDEGDLEFWYRADINSPAYDYHDYSGAELYLYGPDGKTPLYVDQQSAVTNHVVLKTGETLPSAGEDWFVRLRAGRSDYEGLRLITDQDGVVETNAMEVVGDGSWRACVKTPKAVKRFRYRFEPVNRQAPGATAYAENVERWCAKADLEELPNTIAIDRKAREDAWAEVPCDAKTGYLMFRLDEAKESVYAARADWQDFNRWVTAVNDKFVGNQTDTNSTTYVAQQLPIDWSRTEPSVGTNKAWRMDFSVGSGEVPRIVYPRNQPFEEKYESGWTIHNGMWTYGQYAIETEDITKSSGDPTALQLEGRGRGFMELIGAASAPDGIDTVLYTARVAQFNEFENFAYYNGAMMAPGKTQIMSMDDIVFATDLSDITFVTMALMSEKGLAAFDGDASLSLVASYNPSGSGYEFRVSLGRSTSDLRLELYRWTGGEATCLGTNYVTGAATHLIGDYEDKTPASSVKMGRLFISTKKDTSGVNVKAGVALEQLQQGHAALSANANFATVSYYDTTAAAANMKKGTVGVLTRNSPGVFENPVLYLSPVAPTGSSGNKNKFLFSNSESISKLSSEKNLLSDATSYGTWILKDGKNARMEQLTTAALHYLHYGFQAIKDVRQAVLVEATDQGESAWTPIATNYVNGFKDQVFTNVVRSTKKSDVRVKVVGSSADARRDVVINSIELTQWTGQSTPGLDDTSFWGYTNAWVYTSAWVNEYVEGETTNRTITLQPARAKSAADPVSVRAPLMNGFGLLHFAWRNADTAHAKLRVQVATNRVMATDVISLTKAAPDDKRWSDVGEPIAITEAEDERTVYVNLRYPARGLIRLVVDRAVTAAALADTRHHPEYGMLELTDVYAWDLPAYDMHSWIGWNFRAQGWDGTVPGAWANLSDGGAEHGLSGLLNNSLTDLADKDTKYAEQLPHVQSPTFGTNSIGAVDFRARLYGKDDLATYKTNAIVTIYGAKSRNAFGEPTDWMKVADFAVSNGFYRTFTQRFKPSDQFFAIRFAVKGMRGYEPAAGEPADEEMKAPMPLRVAIDDICIYERPPLSINFRKLFVRPFRNADSIKGVERVRDIDSVNEQPLLGESFGFQAEVEVESDEILIDDPDRPLTVDLWYYPKREPWGFENWKDLSDAVHVTLERALGEKLVFRSTVENTGSVCPMQELDEGETYKIVQYEMVAHYYDKSGDHYPYELSAKDWSMAPWNTGFDDPNEAPGASFSGFTLLEAIAPKRAWINEVNLCECDGDDGSPSQGDQWVEIAVPSGVDMAGWQLRLYDMYGEAAGVLMTFGNGCPSSKAVSGDPSHYDFYVVKGPKSTLAADAKWMPITTDMSTVLDGILTYSHPFGFELVRPTGVVEHRAVVQGRNIFEEWGWDVDYLYSGTNLVRTLNDLYGVDDWVWAGKDSHTNRTMTVGVTNGYGSVAVDLPHPDWQAPMVRTPGAKNVGQYIDPNWFVYPNGGYFRILATVLGQHMCQITGGETNKFARLTVQEGGTTSIVYEVDRWYEMGACEVTPGGAAAPVETGTENRKTYYTLTLANITNSMSVTADETISRKLVAAGLGEDNPYRNAVMRWLAENDGNFLGDEIIPGHYRGVDGTATNELDLTTLYWFGLDPTRGGWELWGGMGLKPGSSGGGEEFPVNKPVVKTNPSDPSEAHTNVQTTCWLMITNANDAAFAAYPPDNLQGLANEQSKGYTGNWTSETFRIEMMMANESEDVKSQWHSMLQFVFDGDSFRGAGDAEAPFAARIEVTDPFSRQSPAWEWGWWRYADRGIKPFTRWNLKSGTSPAGVSTLKKDDFLVW